MAALGGENARRKWTIAGDTPFAGLTSMWLWHRAWVALLALAVACGSTAQTQSAPDDALDAVGPGELDPPDAAPSEVVADAADSAKVAPADGAACDMGYSVGQCWNSVEIAGKCSFVPAPESKSCYVDAPCHPSHCDGKGGCVELLASLGTKCATAACGAGQCNADGNCAIETPGATCADKSLCTVWQCSKSGNCEAKITAGAPCAFYSDNPCLNGACSPTGACLPVPGPAGAACKTYTTCAEGVCDGAGKCKDFIAPGKACVTATQCANGVCDAAGKCQDVPASGKVCGNGYECGKGVCDDQGACSNATLVGKPCTGGNVNPCLTGSCDATGSCKFTSKTSAPCPAGKCHAAICNEKGFCEDTLLPAQTTCTTGDVCRPSGACDGQGNCLSGDAAVGAVCGLETACGKMLCNDSGICAFKPTPGQSCPTANPCAVGTCSQSGACVDKITPGAKCGGKTADCWQNICSEKGTCEVVALPGGPCAAPDLCHGPGVCTASGACDAPLLVNKPCKTNCIDDGSCDATGKCVGGGIVGKSCNFAPYYNVNGCGNDGTCDAEGRCAAIKSGQPCSQATQCSDGPAVCDNFGHCGKPAAEGQLCGKQQCGHARCHDSFCVATDQTGHCDDGSTCTEDLCVVSWASANGCPNEPGVCCNKKADGYSCGPPPEKCYYPGYCSFGYCIAKPYYYGTCDPTCGTTICPDYPCQMTNCWSNNPCVQKHCAGLGNCVSNDVADGTKCNGALTCFKGQCVLP